MQAGGLTGSPLFAANLADSELYKRITSLDEDYRMPKRGTISQRDIDKIAKWLTEVSPHVVQPAASATAAIPAPTPTPTSLEPPQETNNGSLAESIDVVQSSQVSTLILLTAVICTLCCWFFYRMTAGRSHRSRISTNGDHLSAFFSMAIGSLTCLMMIAIYFLYQQTNQLKIENEVLRSSTGTAPPSEMVMAPLVEINSENLPLPPHPMHPPRLGGRYYRGNDERSDRLFNGGFYRTATIDLNLVEKDGLRIQWGDEVERELFVEIEVKRAPKSSRDEFTDHIAGLAAIEHFSQSVPGLQQKLKFEVVEKENVWSVKVPLPKLRETPESQQAKGMIYLMYGVQPGEGKKPRPHFAVQYDLRFKDGKIINNSVLWMGSMYTLNNRVMVPEEEQILLDRWFDWRPIPLIEGDEGASMVGLNEHIAGQ